MQAVVRVRRVDKGKLGPARPSFDRAENNTAEKHMKLHQIYLQSGFFVFGFSASVHEFAFI